MLTHAGRFIHRRVARVTLGTAALSLSWASSSFAEETAAPPRASAAPVAETTTVYAGPNRALVDGGLFSFGLSYVPAVIVAATSSQSADRHLYVPVAGPWLDLGERPPHQACRAGSTSCDTETTNKVLIAADGVFQGLGFVSTILGFLAPDHERVVTSAKPSVQLTPIRIGNGGYGLLAFGNF